MYKLITTLVIAAACCMAQKTTAQNILPNASFDNAANLWVPTVVAASVASFSLSTTDTLWGAQSARVNVTAYSGTATSIKYASIAAPTTAGVNYVISFWAKSSVNNNKLDVEADFNSGTDVKRQVNLTNDWRYYEYNITTAAGSGSTAINFYLKGTGIFFIDECRMITEANWFNDANYRINVARKGNFTIKVRRPDGTDYVDSIYINHKMLDYRFGTAMALNSTVLNPANYKWYHDTMAIYFNTGVPENDAKWHRTEPTEGTTNYVKVDSMVRWSDSVGWHEIRGHAFLWGGCKNFHLAPWQAPEYDMAAGGCNAPAGGSALSLAKWFDITRIRILRDGAYWRTKINEWDVLNEGGHETYVRGRAGNTDSIYWQAFRWAKQSNPAMVTTINDFSIVESNAYGAALTGYENLINTIDGKMAASGSGKIDIVGFQAHFFSGDLSGGLIQFNAMRRNMERFGAMGKDMKFTEFDVAGTNQAQHASNIANTMRFCFSHPGMSGLYWWGFWDGKHWRASEEAGMWRADKTRKPSGDSLAKLIRNEWTTNDAGMLNASGERTFRGYYAKYTIRIKLPNGTYKYVDTTLLQPHNNTTVIIQLSAADINGVLPITEIGFSVVKKNQSAAIKLDTRDEDNILRFELERSYNLPTNWIKIAAHAAKNTNGANSYTWTDKETKTGNNFYRIKIVEKDGSYYYTETKVLSFAEQEKSLTITPNPANLTAVVTLPADWVGLSLGTNIINAGGATVQQYTKYATAANFPLQLQSLPAGIYQVVINNNKTGIAKKATLVVAK